MEETIDAHLDDLVVQYATPTLSAVILFVELFRETVRVPREIVVLYKVYRGVKRLGTQGAEEVLGMVNSVQRLHSVSDDRCGTDVATWREELVVVKVTVYLLSISVVEGRQGRRRVCIKLDVFEWNIALVTSEVLRMISFPIGGDGTSSAQLLVTVCAVKTLFDHVRFVRWNWRPLSSAFRSHRSEKVFFCVMLLARDNQ